MGQRSYLAVEGESEICEWQYTTQISDYQWFIFNYIFNNKDKEMEYEEGDDDLFGCKITFSSSLANVKNKLEKLNYTEEKINLFFQEFFDTDSKTAKKMIDAYLYGYDDPDKLDTKFGKGFYDFCDKKDLWDVDLGEIPLIAILLNEIKSNPKKNLLLVIDYRYSQEKKDYWEKLEIISDDDSTEIRIINKYTCMAKVCYSKGELPNVYINLIMGLEYSIRDYILRKTENLSKDPKNDMLNLDNMLKKLSLMDSLKFSIIYLGDEKLDTALFEKVQDVYGIRNNLMHQGMKKFDYVKCADAIQTIEKIIDKINSLS